MTRTIFSAVLLTAAFSYSVAALAEESTIPMPTGKCDQGKYQETIADHISGIKPSEGMEGHAIDITFKSDEDYIASLRKLGDAGCIDPIPAVQD